MDAALSDASASSGHAEDDAVRNLLRGTASSSSSLKALGAEELRRSLRRAQGAVAAEHRRATEAWRSPLSLFDNSAKRAASQRGVPEWAVLTVLKARRLVEEAAGLEDLTDVYETQILTAKREKRGLARAPLLGLLERLDALAQELQAHMPFLSAARAAFDDPRSAQHPGGAEGGRDDACTSVPEFGGSPVSVESAPGAGYRDSDSAAPEAPVVILQPQRRRGFFQSMAAPKEFVLKFLESAIDVVGAAGNATGVSDATLEASQSTTGNAARKNWDETTGDISSWLSVESLHGSAPHSKEIRDWSAAQSLWEGCRRKTDRRWTLA